MRRSSAAHTVGVAFVLPALLGIVRPATAHALGAECTLHDGVVRMEAYFDDDTSAADARVVVRNTAGEIVAEGRTDAKGLWRFPAPPADLYRITVDAGAGHQTTIRLRIPPHAEQPSTPGFVAEKIYEGPSRAEFTSFPWGRAALGLTVIALLFLVWRGLRGWRRRGNSLPELAQAEIPMSGLSPGSERKAQ